MDNLRPTRLPASVVIVLLLAAAACGGQDPSPSDPVPAPAASVDSTQVSTPPAEPLPPAESNAPEVAEETVASPSPAPEPVETVDSTPATSQPAQPHAPADTDAQDAARTIGVGSADLEGHWDGAISIPGPTDLPFAVDMTASGDALRGTIDIQGVSGLPLSNVVLDAGRIHFELDSPIGLAIWEGEVRDGVIEGEFTQAGTAETF